jgi:hypothetical protein
MNILVPCLRPIHRGPKNYRVGLDDGREFFIYSAIECAGLGERVLVSQTGETT